MYMVSLMEQIQIDTLNQTIDKWGQLTFGMGALFVVVVLAVVLALVMRGVFKRDERQISTEDKSLELASEAFKTLIERLPTWVEQMSVSITSLVTATEAQNASLATLGATANHHTSAFQTMQNTLATMGAADTHHSTTLETIKHLLEENAASMRLLATHVENIPAKTIADLTPKLEAMRSTTTEAVSEAIEAKRATDEFPPVKIEGEIKVTTPPPDTLPEVAPISTTIPPEAVPGLLTAPEGKGEAT